MILAACLGHLGIRSPAARSAATFLSARTCGVVNLALLLLLAGTGSGSAF